MESSSGLELQEKSKEQQEGSKEHQEVSSSSSLVLGQRKEARVVVLARNPDLGLLARWVDTLVYIF